MRKLTRKYFISFPLSGRRWISNVLGHYDQLLQGKDPSGIWHRSANPLKKYGTQDAWNLIPTHCTKRKGEEISAPKFYRFRPCFIVIRHPAKVAVSQYKGMQNRNEDFSLSLEEYLEEKFLDYYAEYANQIYRCLGQKNKVFANYHDLFLEQNSDEKPNWESIIRFVFGDLDSEKLAAALDNNNAQKTAQPSFKKDIFKSSPDKMNELHGQELEIKDIVEEQLALRLSPKINKYFEESIY